MFRYPPRSGRRRRLGDVRRVLTAAGIACRTPRPSRRRPGGAAGIGRRIRETAAGVRRRTRQSAAGVRRRVAWLAAGVGRLILRPLAWGPLPGGSSAAFPRVSIDGGKQHGRGQGEGRPPPRPVANGSRRQFVIQSLALPSSGRGGLGGRPPVSAISGRGGEGRPSNRRRRSGRNRRAGGTDRCRFIAHFTPP